MLNSVKKNVPLKLYLALCCLLAISCSKKMSPPTTTPSASMVPVLMNSHLSLKVKISRNEINSVLNQIIQQSINEGLSSVDGFNLTSKLNGPADLQVSQQSVLAQLPLALEISPTGFFSNLNVKGEIKLHLNTSLDIFQDSLLCKTTLTHYEWTKKPKVSVIGVNLPIEMIANFIIKKYKEEILYSIDESIAQNFNLNKTKSLVLDYFKGPLYTADDQVLSVFANPSELALGPFSMSDQDLIIPILAYFESVISENYPDDFLKSIHYSIRPHTDFNSQFNIQCRVPLQYMEQMVKEQTIHQHFGSGLSKVEITHLQISAYDKTLIIQTELSGAYNGKIHLIFDPIFDTDVKKIKLNNFQIKTISGKRMSKIMLSLFRNFAEKQVRSSIEDQLNQTLKEYIEHTNSMLNNYPFAEGIKLNGHLIDYQLKGFQFYKDVMYFNIISELYMEADVKKIKTGNLIFDKF